MSRWGWIALVAACDEDLGSTKSTTGAPVDPTSVPPVPDTPDSEPQDSAPPPPPEDAACPNPLRDQCLNGVDDDGDGAVDCALERTPTAPYAELAIDDVELLSPGDLTGDGMDDLLTFRVEPAFFTSGLALYAGPVAAGQSQWPPTWDLRATGKATNAYLLDLEGDGTEDVVLPTILEPDLLACDEPWGVYVVPLDLLGDADAADVATYTLRPPAIWDTPLPTVYSHPIGDVTDDGFEDLLVSSSNCAVGAPFTHFLVSGGRLVPGENHVDEVSDHLLTMTGDHVVNGAFAVGDVDGDGRDDLAIASSNTQTLDGALYLFTTPPAGYVLDLSAATHILEPWGRGIVREVIAGHDLSGDGLDDLVVAVSGEAGGVWVVKGPIPAGVTVLGSGVGALQGAWSHYPAPATFMEAAIADVNGDSFPDLLYGTTDDLIRGGGPGDDFGVHVDHLTCGGLHPQPHDGFLPDPSGALFVTADVTGDGTSDVVQAAWDGLTGSVRVWRGGGR